MNKHDAEIDQLHHQLRRLSEEIHDNELKEKNMDRLKEMHSQFQFKSLTLLHDLNDYWAGDPQMNASLTDTLDKFQMCDNQLEDNFWEEKQKILKERQQLLDKEQETSMKRQKLIIEGNDNTE